MSSDEVRLSVGAAFAGCMVAVALSAITGFQTFLYFQIFPGDALRYKILVVWIWLLDAAHTLTICFSVWTYTITNFGDVDYTKQIVPFATVAFTAITTVSVNCFYAWRIHKMSKATWWLTGTILLLAITRLGMRFALVLTCGMSVSAATDIVVSVARYYYLRNLKQGYSGTQEVVDAVVVFTINDGCLTCAVAIAAIIFLLRMPGNMVWLSIYFSIGLLYYHIHLEIWTELEPILGKLFSNSVLATLNLRNWYRYRPRPMGIPMTGRTQAHGTHTVSSGPPVVDKRGMDLDSQRMEVFVDQQVEYNVAVGGFMSDDNMNAAPNGLDIVGFRSLMDDMTASLAAARSAISSVHSNTELTAPNPNGISLLNLKPQILLSYMQSLLLLSAHRALGHTLSERSPPTQPFSNSQRDTRGADAGDLVDGLIEGRVVLEKVRVLEGRMRYQIEKLVRAAQAPESGPEAAVDDPLAFRPNPANLLNQDGEASDVSDNENARESTSADRDGDNDGIYRPPRLAPVPYTAASKGKKTRAPPVPSALRALHDPFMPHIETTSGLGGIPALESARAKQLRRITEFEEENFGRVVMGKGANKRRLRDEEDLALGAELGGGQGSGGKNRRRGGLEDEFGDVLRSVDRGGRGGVGDGYDELRKGARKKNVLERAKANVRQREEEPDGAEAGGRMRKKSRFEQDTKMAKRRLKKNK
ncbi:hypothetical protein R3P38DRAFT_3311739 [Favolaschia claudopus]|uniref:DUF6534 domain-containing protein n=1 Tax=Favolaschia claudopus TaxID=2862362 RepID=A0AAW0C9W1_9AGAR